MHIQTHILSGWCAAAIFPLTPRQRLLAMIAAACPDLDGLGILFGQEIYWHYHHKLGHNIFFGVALALVLAVIARRWLLMFPLYLGLFHLHLLMDYYGSGTGWRIYYFWPAGNQGLKTSHTWEFYSWQNISAAAAMVLCAIFIAIRQGRTPLELLMPSLDRQLVGMFRRAVGRDRRAEIPEARLLLSQPASEDRTWQSQQR